MFPSRYFADRMFAPRYFPKVGAEQDDGTPSDGWLAEKRSVQWRAEQRGVQWAGEKRSVIWKASNES